MIRLIDKNLNAPEFVGTTSSGIYPAAVSTGTQQGQDVVSIIAHDRDGTAPNNAVSSSKLLNIMLIRL